MGDLVKDENLLRVTYDDPEEKEVVVRLSGDPNAISAWTLIWL